MHMLRWTHSNDVVVFFFISCTSFKVIFSNDNLSSPRVLSQSPPIKQKTITANNVSQVILPSRHSAYVIDEESGKSLPGTPEPGVRKETSNWTPEILRRKENIKGVETATDVGPGLFRNRTQTN